MVPNPRIMFKNPLPNIGNNININKIHIVLSILPHVLFYFWDYISAYHIKHLSRLFYFLQVKITIIIVLFV